MTASTSSDGGAARRLDCAQSLFVVIDVQERLAPHVLHAEALIARIGGLTAAARRFGVPVLATEHCPDQIGPLVASLRTQFDTGEIFQKTHFGATDHREFVAEVDRRGPRQIVVAGMEAHVCVMQTVLGLASRGHAVTLVGDATGSRAARQDDRGFAFERMRRAGVVIAGTETVLFEWTQAGDDAAFRDVLKIIKTLPPSA